MTTGYEWARKRTTAALKAELASRGKSEALPQPGVIELPYPPRVLSPNSRVHWSDKAKVAKRFKADCIVLLLNHRVRLKGCFKFSLRFMPPSNRRADIDNMLASFKQGIDALSHVSGVDDSKFVLEISKGEKRTGGAVLLTA